MTPEEHKEAVKEAFKEWLDDLILQFGKWSLKTIAAAAFGFLIVFLINHGYLTGH